ncbi:retron Ec78 anti-phage system effector HNH endonuclease PtuB [Ferrimonas balearica]|uniref:retron Ec78 anti-phage system effector HNH endonuclease PtuB n=1 Tax=Ferrimonas balearica TaxID=44012 RepID=UPI001C598AA7|nr:retron Ec78 anti-phage system effector HNH endonuclease PtuB [Ferrimonas balearica]MBW3164597.1 TIGR02646 family protein [Ferrimonas balearica]
MKYILKGDEPPLLERFRTKNPNYTWDQCKKNTKRRNQIQQTLREDQGGLCLYCEIDLIPAEPDCEADFRVEHFHPKSDKSSGHNWDLDWSNLFACCHGGHNPNVSDAANRHTNPDVSCDIPKDNNILDDVILNPLSMPKSHALFDFDRASGSISVHHGNCELAGVDKVKAQATIDNLRLDADRLRRLRSAELNRVNELLRGLIEGGMSVAQAREHISKALLKRNGDNNWPKFFSALRSYLGQAAEQQLRRIGYIN